MRYVVCELQTGTQDVRLPVQVDSPFTGNRIELSDSPKHGDSVFTYLCPESGKEFDVLGMTPGIPEAKPYSERFEVGRNFCNKLWNSARFAFLNLEDVPFEPRDPDSLALEDRWILSRLTTVTAEVQRQLGAYNASAALSAAREFFWTEFCDWYLEILKPRMRDDGQRGLAQQVLATVLDQTLRLLHPFVPFITEELWTRLRAAAPRRGIDSELPDTELIVHAAWPRARPDWRNEAAEATVGLAQEVVTRTREIRARYQVAATTKVAVVLVAKATCREALEAGRELIAHMTTASGVDFAAAAPDVKDAATARLADVEIYVPGVVDLEQEKQKLIKLRDQLRGRIEGTRRKLANEGFVSKAPPEVVKRERNNLESLEAQLVGVEASLTALD